MSIEALERRGSSPEFVVQAPISMVDILGGKIEMQQSDDMNDWEMNLYNRWGVEPLVPFVRDHGKRKEILILGPSVQGRELQYLFYMAGPSKAYDESYEDTQDDWYSLLHGDSTYLATLLEQHRKIPNWHVHEPHLDKLREFIKRNKGVVVPVIHLFQEDDTLSWDFSPLPSDVLARLKRDYDVPTAMNETFPILGPLLPKAYSRDATTVWQERLSMGLTLDDYDQDMGATQVLALTLAKSDQLLGSRAITQLVRYALTGQVPCYFDEVSFIGITEEQLRDINLPPYALESIGVSFHEEDTIYDVIHVANDIEGPRIYVKNDNVDTATLKETGETIASIVNGDLKMYSSWRPHVNLAAMINMKEVSEWLEEYRSRFGNVYLNSVKYVDVPIEDMKLIRDLPYAVYTSNPVDVTSFDL